jgi:pimeloyl-ACP methyl ester carboxylesterase
MTDVPASMPPMAAEEAARAHRGAWMDVDWAAARRWLRLDGRWVNVVELGDGPPVVLVHGLSGCWQNWLETLPALAETHRVIALDLPGFGSSEMPRDPITISGYGRLLDELCDALDVDAAAVIGNSMGGFVGTELALAFPQRVERLVLISAAGISSDAVRREPLLAAGRAFAMTAGWVATRQEAFARRPRLRRIALQLVARHPEQLSAPLAYELMRGSGRPGFLPALEACLAYPIRDRLPEIACPTLILWGENDHVIPVKDADRFERLIPNTRKVVLPDTGHVSMLERPELVNALLQRFLEEEPPAPPA